MKSGSADEARAANAPELDPGQDIFQIWTPNGKRIIYSSNRGGQKQYLGGSGANGYLVYRERLTTRQQ